MRRGTYRKKRSTRRKQRGGQTPAPSPKAFAFENLHRGEGSEQRASWEQSLNLSFLNAPESESRPTPAPAPAPVPAPVPGIPVPPPRPVEQTPPSSLEFQIFFTDLDRIIRTYRIHPQEISQFIILLGSLITELYLNSEEVLRVLKIYENLLQNRIPDRAAALWQHVSFLKRTGRL